MTVSKTTTQEKAREFARTLVGDPLGIALWSTNEVAEFADSLTAELQKENARLREALEKISALKAGPCRGFNLERCETCIAREALGQVRKP